MVLIGVGFDGLDMIRIGVGIGITINPILHGEKEIGVYGELSQRFECIPAIHNMTALKKM